ncbi:MAG: ABC transporter ATP-binding protein [Anaerolineaceae bacterium]|nr:ABC transporter ATP-binding protein [Anaerolineaceae bacterium]
MLRLIKYTKPYIPLILLAILLLFVQANCDLALPDYLSKIVNNGIQQGGVENAVPDAIRQSQMERISLFMSQEDQSEVLSQYRLVDQSSPDYEQYVEKYPALANEAIYVLTTTDPAEIERLNPVMGKALLAVNAIQKLAADPAQAAAAASQFGFDLSRLPAGTDVFTLLGNLPAEQRTQMLSRIDQQFATMDDSTIVQSAASAVKDEYTALGMDASQLQNNYIVSTGGVMLLIALLGAVCTVTVGLLSARTAAGMSRDLRKDVFQKVESFSGAEMDQFSTASLITRTTNDITQIQLVVMMIIRMVFYAPIMGVGGIIRAIDKDSSMWWIIAVAVAILLSLVVVIFSISLPKFRVIQNLVDRLNLVTREQLSGMMVIRAFNMQPFEQKRFDTANQDLTDTNLFVNRVMVVMMPAMMLIMNGLSLLIIWVGSHQVAAANMQVGDMMAFLQYSMQIVFSFLMLSFMFIIIPRASVSANRIAEVLDTKTSINDPQEPKHFPLPFKGTVEFRDVCFRYPGADEDVLHDVSFTAQPGQTTAIIGSTGSGKSTVINLVPRFYDVSEGAILLDGTDIRQVSQHELRDKIGYIPQKSSLFSGTIESNLRYADEDASQEVLQEAVEIAQAAEFINTRQEGMDGPIAQGGSNVSGGQKQRLSIARALVKRAPVYIFDDSFSALDFKTDSALRRALRERTISSTLIVVTQRISTIKNAEQIIVLDEGKVVGKGTHRELMESCDTYREIALSQLSMEELA